MERVLDDERPQGLVFLPAKDLDDEGVRPRVLAAGPTTTETARAERRALADPAVHPYAPLTADPKPAEPT